MPGNLSFAPPRHIWGMLVSVLKEVREKGGHVSLINPNREIQRLLQITGLERVFRVQHSAFA